MFHSVTEKFHSVTEKFHSVIEKFRSVTEKCPALLASVTEKFHSVTENFFQYTRNFSVTLGLESHYIECVEKRTWCDRKVLGKAIVCGKCIYSYCIVRWILFDLIEITKWESQYEVPIY